jgi:hypothetical protein
VFSLRHVGGCLRVLEAARRPLSRLRVSARHSAAVARRIVVTRSLPRWFLFEDKFWSYDATRLSPSFSVAPAEAALDFAFETEPRFCFERTGGRLRFGCHKWTLHDRDFWGPYLLDEARA